MTPWIRTGRRFVAALCAVLATSGVAHAQVQHSQGPVFPDTSIGRVEMPLSATGGTGGPYTWSVIVGDLPPGLALRTDTPPSFPAGASGIIGVATTVGTYSFTLRVTDGVETVDQPTGLTITSLRVKDSQILPDAFVGVGYSYQLTALDSGGQVTWTHTDPVNFPLPSGVTLSATGLLSGIPTAVFNNSFSIGLTDGTDTVYQGLSLRVSAIEISTPGVLPNVSLNTYYTATIAAAGGTGGLTFSQNGGLPNGLSMDSSGLISGTVTNSHVGKFQLGVTATDASSASYTKAMSIDVVGAAPLLPNISPYGNAFDDCTIGVPCNRGVGVFFGGTAPFAWSIGGLPPSWMDVRTGDGVTSSWVTPGDAELWGTPDAAGTFNVQLTVTDATGATATNTFQLNVSSLLQNSFLPPATLGTPYSQVLRVIGGAGPYTAARTGGTLATGLALDSETLTLGGTPAESGYFTPIFTYADSDSLTLTTSTFLNIYGAGSGGVSINSNSDLGWTTTGSPFSRTLNACCAGSITWSQTSGSLPAGVTLSAGGSLNGTPTVAGPYTFMVRAADSSTPANFAERQFTLNVTSISINGNSTLTSGNAGTFYTNTFTASGGSGTLAWTLAPFSYLPPNMTLASNGTLNGEPSASGQFVFIVVVTDANSRTASRQFSLSLYPEGTPPPVYQSQSSNFGTFSIGQLETSLSATGGNGTYTWSVEGGTLPPGLAVRTDMPSYFQSSASAGLIGVATAPGLYSFTLRATSGDGHVDQASTLRVTALVNKESQLPDAFVTVPYSYQLTALGYAGAGATWTSPSGLPAGLSLSTTGLVSGTPTTASFPNISFTLSDGVDTVFKSVNFTIYAVRITTPGVLPNVTPGGSYNTTIVAAGGTGGITFNANGLPNGLSFNSSSGLISGTVNSNSSLGKVSVSVTAMAGGGGSYTKTMSIDVIGASPTLPSIAPSGSFIYDCTLGVSCNRTISVQNGGAAPFTWTASGLPPGMSIRFGSGNTTSFVTPGDAQLWGTPTAIDTYNVQLTVTDALGATATNTFPMKVSPLMQTTFLQSGTIDTAYSQTLRVLGGTGGPYTAVQTGGQLAAGLSVNTLLVLSGFPAESGNFNPVFTYADSASGILQVDSSFFINGAGGSGFSINTSSNLGSRSTGSSFSSNPLSFSACCASPITWSLVAPSSLPPGVTLTSATGALNGTLTTSGTYTFLLKATGTPGTNYAARLFTLNVTALSIQTSTLAFGNVDSAYTQTLTATGGTGAITWTLNAGSYLPPGLTLASNGVLSGTPTQSGQYLFSITATDSATPSNVRSNSFRVSIYPVGGVPPVAISTNGSFGTFSIGQIETALTATGGNGTYTWSLFSGTLPPGISIRTDKPSCCFSSNASAGLIGVATTPNLYNFTLRVSSGGTTADLVSTLRVTALVVKENQLPDAFVGVPYSYALSAAGNAGTKTWTASGSLPPGLSLSSAGVVSGTPTNAGFSNINFSLTDTVHTVSNKGVSLNIYAVRITSPAVLPNVTVNTPYSATITAAGGAGGHTFSANGLPYGLSLDTATGVVSGTVDSGNSSLGNVTVSVTASDSGSASYTKTMSIDVVAAAPTLMSIVPSNSNIYDCTLGVPCTRTLFVDGGGTAPFTWTATGLPPGMSIRFGSGTTSWVTPGDVELWGAATATGPYSVELTVTDALAATVTDTFPMTVSQLLQTNYLPDGTIDTPYSQTLRVLGGTGPYTVAKTAGQLPAGVTLNGGTLVLGGTPVESGWGFDPVFTYTDSASHTLQVDNFLYINGAGAGSISIDQNYLGPLTVGSFYSNQFSACCAGSITWSKTGSLPPGLTLSSGGLLSGTPSTSGTYTFLLKATDGGNAGNYAARQFTLNVTPPAGPSISLSATSVTVGGTVTATVANGPANAADYIGLYLTGAASTSANRLSYQFLNGLLSAPTSGVSGAALTVIMPTTPGTYDVRFFLNNTLTVLATSGAITVLGPNVTMSATSVAPGGTVTATVANGPANAGDYIGLYATGASSAPANRLSYQFLNGLVTAPTSGVSGAALTITMPTTPGTYNVRFFLNNTSTLLATSAAITVLGPSVALSATSVVPGGTVTATVANGPANAGDYIGLYATGASSAPANRLSYQFLNGLVTIPTNGVSGAALTVTMPTTPGTYNVRFFLNNTSTLLATSAAITVLGPSVALSATSVVPGGTVTATVANGPANAGDYIGLYATGASSAPANRLSYQFLNGLVTIPTSGVTGAALTITLPTTPGTYDVRFFLNNTSTLLATSAAITVLGPSVALSATSVVPGGTVTATVANGPANAGDYIGLYATGASSAPVNRLSYQFLNGLVTIPSSGVTGAALTITMPTTPGTYNVRFFLNNTSTLLATSAAITVLGPSVALSATSVAPGGTVTATVANGPANAGDYIGLYATGASSAPANRLSYQFLNGLVTIPTSGVSGAALTVTMPTTPGTYDVRFFLNNTSTLLATSAAITVLGPSVALSATSVAAGGTVTATVANGPANAGDYVGLYPTGASSAPANRLSYQFLNGSVTIPTSGVSGATLTITMPTTPGTYDVRFFLNNTSTVLATSAAITVFGPSVTLSATSVVPGGTVTATVANGPANAGDYIGLYPTGASSASANRLSYQFLNGSMTAPTSGVSGADLTVTLPYAPGTYDVRFFRNNTLTLLATSATVTVE